MLALYIGLAVLLLIAIALCCYSLHLRVKLSYYKSALDTVSVPIVLFSDNNKCFYVNDSSKGLLGTVEDGNYSQLAAKFESARVSLSPVRVSNAGHKALIGVDMAEPEKSIELYKKKIY